ncbi:MAG: response regulator [Chloroflexi bacterium]|nr:response regulator [Chloroflexota bacterium]MBK6710224.1 response regulator [Chloroflexota bacterium]MBK7178453.1 response regulator [Chloroflexota bacterium]MBP6804248.1 response regulator [Chloroflexota bacterium]MBP7591235.1 response regulator [Chloroflexota bacterium]
MNQKGRILVVDDNPIACENLEDLLAPQGYELAFANNGVEALTQTSEFDPDLILLDVMMPQMDGFEVCRRLRAASGTAEVPIILITALDDRASRLQGIASGADDFISKPFDSVELRARIQGIMRLNRYRRLMLERTKFERVVENAATGYLLVSEQDKVLFVNPMAAMLLNLPSDRTLNHNETFLSLVKQQYRREPRDAWANWPERPLDKQIRYLVRPESPTAQAIWLQVDTLDHLASGQEPTWIIGLNDVTEQITAQRDRRKFHTMITHKMRTPFISILTGLELLDRYSEELSRNEIAELSRDAYKWAKRLYEDIEEIIRYVDPPLEGEPTEGFNLAHLPVIVTNVCASIGVQHITITGAEDMLSLRATLSRSAMEMIFWEVLGNAKKFHPEQSPTIEVHVAYENAGQVTVHISDDGLTLSPEHLAQVWTPYYQGEKYFTGQLDGMGLGLSLVASLVWSVGGQCRLYNRVGRSGITVDLTLPCIPILKKGDPEMGR